MLSHIRDNIRVLYGLWKPLISLVSCVVYSLSIMGLGVAVALDLVVQDFE